MTARTYIVDTLAETQAWGASLAPRLHIRDILLLRGDLGAGKTTLARSIITTLNPTIDAVPSPTFTLLQTYDTSLGPLYHFDLYRLEQLEECLELDLDEAFGTGICLIEWPDRLGSFILPPYLEITLHFKSLIDAESEDQRRVITIQGPLLDASRVGYERWPL